MDEHIKGWHMELHCVSGLFRVALWFNPYTEGNPRVSTRWVETRQQAWTDARRLLPEFYAKYRRRAGETREP